LLTVWTLISGVSTLCLWIPKAFPLEIRGGDIVEVNGLFEIEDLGFRNRQLLLDQKSLRMQIVEIPVEGVVIQVAEVNSEDVPHRHASYPIRHGVLGERLHEPVEGHDFCELTGARIQTGLQENLVQLKLFPNLMPHMNRSGLTGLDDFHLLGVDRNEVRDFLRFGNLA